VPSDITIADNTVFGSDFREGRFVQKANESLLRGILGVGGRKAISAKEREDGGTIGLAKFLERFARACSRTQD
jgi:hypothetical protein